MRAFLIPLLLSLLLVSLPAQLKTASNDGPIKGTFYVSVDDYAKIFVNGKEVYRVTVAGDSRSNEIELSVGDRIVFQLTDAGGGHRFMTAFVSTDGQTTISFRNQDFRIVPDLELTDFTVDKLSEWKKFAKKESNKPRLPIKSSSEWVWGELNKTILAGVITPGMITKKSR